MMMNVQLEQLVEYTRISRSLVCSECDPFLVCEKSSYVRELFECFQESPLILSVSLFLSQLIYIQLKPSQSRTHTLLSYQGFHRNSRQYKFNREP